MQTDPAGRSPVIATEGFGQGGNQSKRGQNGPGRGLQKKEEKSLAGSTKDGPRVPGERGRLHARRTAAGTSRRRHHDPNLPGKSAVHRPRDRPRDAQEQPTPSDLLLHSQRRAFKPMRFLVPIQGARNRSRQLHRSSSTAAFGCRNAMQHFGHANDRMRQKKPCNKKHSARALDERASLI